MNIEIADSMDFTRPHAAFVAREEEQRARTKIA